MFFHRIPLSYRDIRDVLTSVLGTEEYARLLNVVKKLP